ncbi:DUF2840 domain-containing protein [Sphingobium sp. PAMC28499]|uniref:DUF2840 domain-containing protein n=1 Tax=Sphingobium sp. PAMC28499 TaxID=2565554 RepID=UPI00109DD5BB|nr:DUF2840 domain-containing protein [Sphingobium sp. PAMC28499]QCB37272.1 DUF2840 domain-containing protein [Sphingobium sp. PAMC28499]
MTPARDRAGPGTAVADKKLHTDIELVWIEKRIEHWIRFGNAVDETIHSRCTRILRFPPNSPVALVRWSTSDYGTIRSRIDIMRTVIPGEACSTLPFVRPGAQIWLSIEGGPKVQLVLETIDAIEAAGIDPCAVVPEHWSHVADRIAAGEQPRAYTAERHVAWRKRKALGR